MPLKRPQLLSEYIQITYANIQILMLVFVAILSDNEQDFGCLKNEPRYEKNRLFAYAKTKTQISFAVTAKLISAFVFATRIVQSLYFLNTIFQASSHLVWLYSLVCIGPGRKPRRPVFSKRGSNKIVYSTQIELPHNKMTFAD